MIGLPDIDPEDFGKRQAHIVLARAVQLVARDRLGDLHAPVTGNPYALLGLYREGRKPIDRKAARLFRNYSGRVVTVWRASSRAAYVVEAGQTMKFLMVAYERTLGEDSNSVIAATNLLIAAFDRIVENDHMRLPAAEEAELQELCGILQEQASTKGLQ